jgi:hypothetical protein
VSLASFLAESSFFSLFFFLSKCCQTSLSNLVVNECWWTAVGDICLRCILKNYGELNSCLLLLVNSECAYPVLVHATRRCQFGQLGRWRRSLAQLAALFLLIALQSAILCQNEKKTSFLQPFDFMMCLSPSLLLVIIIVFYGI